jgi:hypothetical protein
VFWFGFYFFVLFCFVLLYWSLNSISMLARQAFLPLEPLHQPQLSYVKGQKERRVKDKGEWSNKEEKGEVKR